MMALALMATIGAGSASAKAGFSADSYPATLAGKQSITPILKLGSEMQCDVAGLSASVSAPSTSLTTTPADTNCYAFGNTLPLKFNGCKLIFHAGSGTEGTVDIGPAGCGPIRIQTAYCDVTIGAQTGFPAFYTESGKGSSSAVKISTELAGFKYTVNSGSCRAKGTYADGKYIANWDVTARNGKSEQVGLHAGSIGLFIGGTPPFFQAERYPVPASGQMGSSSAFKMPSGEVRCNTVSLSSSLTSASFSALVLSPKVEGCAMQFFSATVNYNGCSFLFHLDNTAPPYTGDVDLKCEGAKTIEVIKFGFPVGTPVCKLTVGAQSGLEGVTYANVGEGTARGISTKLAVTGIKYTLTALTENGCETTPGTFSNGVFNGSTTVASF